VKRTSETHPLEINFIDAFNGRIGMTSFPGIVETSPTGSWDRDLDADLDAIKAAGATVLLTLNEAHELQKFTVTEERLEQGCAARGLTWHWLPIEDMSLPDARFFVQWDMLSLDLCERLDAGETVVFHCKAGLGRTGTVVAQLLVETGLSPEQAIHVVRDRRPGTIETKVQEEYVRTLRP